MSAQSPGGRINLRLTSVLMLDANSQALEILVQVLTGFGVKAFHRCTTVVEAREVVERAPVDLIIADGRLPGIDGYDFVRWLRRLEQAPNRHTPVIMVSGHTSAADVAKARDCGANFFVAKPITPGVLLERILWVAREKRAFIDAGAYVGPDRRFKNEGPPAGVEGRRRTDLHGDLGAAVTPNMSQNDIDALMSPRKASL
ncbi:two-component system response regulator [Caulobacter sp. CCUG 60055]|uniref:response regulator n=1 Tax=Caulobacter sp. CCUG 60055 TaxID=2100090 RepID=UPI001FA7800D|nr:response regulator [Caulobacter sp. CCUG 60055]MBQ1541106.1 response regulator [Caulobacteraceae bacterium]MCI3181387.1 two-component system response regulator [Caulobacter sp. CCUG 60055]